MSNFTINGKEVDIATIPDGTLTLAEWETVRSNSVGFAELYPKLNNEALVAVVQHNLSNCERHPNYVYDGSLKNLLVPLLCSRLK